MNRYFKNFIVCQEMDQYCLLCKETFQRVFEIEKHIRWEHHRKRMKALVPFAKYAKESIHKLENIYYCEVCNAILPKLSDVKDHVKTEKHKFCKTNPSVKSKGLTGCYDKGFILVSQCVLSKAMWHAIINNTCHICDVPVNDVQEHIAMESHMLKFLQCETKHEDSEFYRKINEDKYHCWSCKAIYSAVDYEQHLSDCEAKDESEVKALFSFKRGMKSTSDTATVTPIATDTADDLSADLPADDLSADLPAEDLPADLPDDHPADLPADDLSADVPAEDLPADHPADLPAEDLSADVPAQDPSGDVPADLPDEDLSADLPAEDLSADHSTGHSTGHTLRPPSDLVAEYDGAVTQMTEMADRISICDDVKDLLLVNFNDFFIIDITNKTAKCLYCSSTISYDLETILVHVRDEHHTTAKTSTSQDLTSLITGKQEEVKVKSFDNGKKRSDLAKFGKANHIKLNFNGTKGYCTLCDKYLSASMRVFEEHLNGLIHMGHLELLNLVEPNISRVRVEYTTESIMDYVKTLQYAQKTHTVVINDEIYLNMNHFLLVSPIKNNPHYVKTKCYVCQEYFEQGTEAEHCVQIKHKDNFVATSVMPRPVEFVRMLRPNLFHCGFCNVTLPFSKALETHMLTKKHRNSRIANILLKAETEISYTVPESSETSNASTLTAEPYSDLLLSYCDSTRL